MMNKTIAHLIPGIFCLMLMSSASAWEAGAPGHSQWRPLQGQEGAIANGAAGIGQSAQLPPPAPWQRVADYPNAQRAYRFRPFAGYPGQGTDNRYRFRPMEAAQKRSAPLRWTYRPAQIEIPNHYVYRPLNARQARASVTQQRRSRPVPPGLGDYAYNTRAPRFYPYGRFGAPTPGSIPPYFAPYRYPSAQNPAWTARPGLTYPGYGNDVAAYPVPRRAAVPRYSANMPYSGYRFRPRGQSGPQRYRYRDQRARYAVNPYAPPPNHPRYMPGQAYAYGRYRGWSPPVGLPAPGMEQAMWRPVVPNRYGIDWYDGQADGEGAWYKLAEQREWPRVSQY